MRNSAPSRYFELCILFGTGRSPVCGQTGRSRPVPGGAVKHALPPRGAASCLGRSERGAAARAGPGSSAGARRRGRWAGTRCLRREERGEQRVCALLASYSRFGWKRPSRSSSVSEENVGPPPVCADRVSRAHLCCRPRGCGTPALGPSDGCLCEMDIWFI